MSTYFSAIKKIASGIFTEQTLTFSEVSNIKILINDENMSENFEDIESGEISLKTFFTNDEWLKVSSILSKFGNNHQILGQILNDVNRRKELLKTQEI
jgi:hypothetical protein